LEGSLGNGNSYERGIDHRVRASDDQQWNGGAEHIAYGMDDGGGGKRYLRFSAAIRRARDGG
jgi:hypothetical protein